jgi:hypothetical protein
VLPEYASLPPGFNPRTAAAGRANDAAPRRWRRRAAPLVLAALNRLRTGGYAYTLEPGVYGEHTADEFWFDRKEGFCEHIASAFAVLMRAMDIPARVVTGYQGGERNRWTASGSCGKAMRMPGPRSGWPAAAGCGSTRPRPWRPGAPARCQRWSAARRARRRDRQRQSQPGASLRAAWEAINNSWNQWVLNYTQSKQLNLLKDIGFESPSWEDLSYVLLAIVVLVALLGAAWAYWDRVEHDPWLRLLGRTRRRPAQGRAGAVRRQSAPKNCDACHSTFRPGCARIGGVVAQARGAAL